MKKNKILIFGGHGQLAKCIDHLIKNHYLDGYDFIFLSHGDCDISKYPRVRDTINKYNIIDSDTKVAAVINCAAYNNVDLAETIGYEDNIMTNVVGVNNLALVCHEFNIPIVHISTNYVFNGDSMNPYIEEDIAQPISEYGKAKYNGELVLKRSGVNYAIIRTGWLMSPYGSNFLTKIITKCKGNDVIDVPVNFYGAPTSALDLADFVVKITRKLIANNLQCRIYNFTNSGSCSWYDAAKFIALNSGNELRAMYPVPVLPERNPLRPQNSTLCLGRIYKEFNIVPQHWTSAILDILKHM